MIGAPNRRYGGTRRLLAIQFQNRPHYREWPPACKTGNSASKESHRREFTDSEK
jgi:hypothetical protein